MSTLRWTLLAVPCWLALMGCASTSPATEPARSYRAESPRAVVAAGPAEIAFTHATVVDVEHGTLLPGHTVLVSGGRITGVVADTGAPVAARVVDASGSFIIPGLWDMHAHALNNFERSSAFLLINGITGIRQPGNSRLDSLRAVQSRVRNTTQALPRLYAAGVLIDGDPPVRPDGSVVLTDARDARKLVDSLVASGADFLKVYARLKRGPFMALAAEAKRRGIALTGHVPNEVSPAEASNAGMRLIDHIFEIPLGCSSREPELRAERVEAEGRITLRAVRMALLDTILATYDRSRCQALARRLARNGTYIDPTIWMGRVYSHWGDASLRDSAAFRFYPPQRRQLAASPPIPEFAGDQQKADSLYRIELAIIREMHRAGVQFLAGTDATSPGIVLGFSLHDELRTLVVEAGFSPAEALRTATLNPARFLHATDSLGTVAAGKLADMVLLDANPLADIRNTRKVRAVMVRGHYLDRAALDSITAALERRARPQ